MDSIWLLHFNSSSIRMPRNFTYFTLLISIWSIKTGGFDASFDLSEANKENVHLSMLKLTLLF